jgi:colicin import membrane protein
MSSITISNGGWLEKKISGAFKMKSWQKRFFHLDYDTGALVHYKNEQKDPKDRKVKMKLADLHGVDRVQNMITVTGDNKEVLVLRAESAAAADPWFDALNKDFEEARRAREERLMREAADKAEREANARGQKKLDEMDEEHRRKQADLERQNAAKIAEQQKLLDEQTAAREQKEAELAHLEAERKANEEAQAKLAADAEREAEEAEKAKAEAEAKAKAEADATAAAKAKAEAAAKAKAEAEAKRAAAETARLEAAALGKLQREARFSGPNSVYHEAPSTWVDYGVITKNQEIMQRRSINAKKAANDWLQEQAKSRRASTTAP